MDPSEEEGRSPKGQSEACTSDDAGALQASFEKWRLKRVKAEKKKKKKHEELIASVPELSLPREDPGRMQYLRQRFIDGCRKYIGVAYGARFHEPENCKCEGCEEAGRQIYNDELSLDCCGLIRQVLFDLQGELGFRIGRGNQAYQFDTLPIRVNSLRELQPGDLVFYSGSYLNPKSKPKPFDMTHVEVFIGGETGEATIGSRNRYRWVMEYPSCYFEPKRWTLIDHFYCRIDSWLQGAPSLPCNPWLQGVCQPAHPEFWISRAKQWSLHALKYSVLQPADEDGQGADDELD